jgi:hypothetical protein
LDGFDDGGGAGAGIGGDIGADVGGGDLLGLIEQIGEVAEGGIDLAELGLRVFKIIRIGFAGFEEFLELLNDRGIAGVVAGEVEALPGG